MEERIFTLKKGTEVAPRFDGLTVPFQVPSTLADMVRVAGGDEQEIQAAEDALTEATERKIVSMFNQAYALQVQKHVKNGALDEDATPEKLRERVTQYKMPAGDRARRQPGTGKARAPKPIETEKASALDALLAANPALREQAAALGIKLPEETPAQA
jgi:hypothetical protein